MLAYFSPSKWAAAVAQTSNSLAFPDVMLKRLDTMYQEGLAKLVVKNNLRGIFTMAEPREPINDGVMDMTADIFVSKLGGELSVFGALHYFASYLTEYKASYGRFDLQDVVRQCHKAYLPKWRGWMSRVEKKEAEKESQTVQTGKAALWKYLREEYVAKGLSVKESNLFQQGYLSELDADAIDNGVELLF